jgi:CheY-like chemotaxis protein
MRIFFADDEPEFQSSFLQKHNAPDFQITHTADVYSIPRMLDEAPVLPDLVVLDLYATRASPLSDEAKIQNERVNQRLAALDRDIVELKKVVDEVKTPAAIEVVRQIRRNPKLTDVPILLYTRQGLSLLGDEELNEAMRLDTDWMLKGRSKELERACMTSYVTDHRTKRQRLKRDVVLTIAGALLGAIVGTVFAKLF